MLGGLEYMIDIMNNTDIEDISKKILEKKMSCPICHEQFVTPRARMPKIRLHEIDTDLRPYYEGIDVVAYEVVTCPNCGYSAIFKTFDNITEARRQEIADFMKDKYQKKEWPKIVDTQTAIEKFLLALQCLTPKHSNIGEHAYIYLKMAWLFRVHTREDAKEKEQFCLQKFVECAEQTFAEVRFPILDFEESVFLYLIGEECRRIGDYERAYKYVGKVLLDKNSSDKLRERAKDVRDLIRDERPDFSPE